MSGQVREAAAALGLRLRRSELAGLAWADVDLERRHLHIRQAQSDHEFDSTEAGD